MKAGGLVLIACACGGAAKTVPPANKTAPSGQAISADAFCTRLAELNREHCGNFDSFKVADADCRRELADLHDSDRKTDRVLQAVGHCMVDHASCDAVDQCMAGLSYDDPGDLRACSDPNDGRAVGVPAALFAERNGATVKTFGQASSSKAKPIEMCGITGGTDWLAQLTCNDGSRPIAGRDDAERARVGNVGPGGHCGSIIDLYRIRCPETSYEVYVDGYVCPLPR